MYALMKHGGQKSLAGIGIVLTLNAMTAPILATDSLLSYRWQTERTEQSVTPWVMDGLRTNDAPFLWEDIPDMFFPHLARRIEVYWQKGRPDSYQQPLFVRNLLYAGQSGDLCYYTNWCSIEPGYNVIEIKGTKDFITGEARLPIFYYYDGPGLGVAQFYGFEVDDFPIWEGSTHLVTSDGGIWPDFNSVWVDSVGGWVDGETAGLRGNWSLRYVFSPLCPNRIGDIDGDFDIDENDRGWLEWALSFPDEDVLGDMRIYMDLNNDFHVNGQDLAIFETNYTGENVLVVCPWITADTETLRKVAPARSAVAPDVVNLALTEDSKEFYVAWNAPWLNVSPSIGVVDQGGRELTVSYDTANLLPGRYEGKIVVQAEVGNSPIEIPVSLNLQPAGDLNLDGRVDVHDINVFANCGTGPEVLYDPDKLPVGCPLLVADNIIAADLDADGDVDQVDFAEMQRLVDAYGPPLSVVEQFAVETLDIPAGLAKLPPRIAAVDMLSGWSRQAPAFQYRPLAENFSLGGVIVILALALVVSIIYDYCAPVCHSLIFFNGREAVSPGEAVKIRAAIDFLGTMNAYPQIQELWFILSQPDWYNMENTGRIMINETVAEEDEQDIAATNKKEGREGTVIHWSYINGKQWEEGGKRYLAVVLLGEAQHLLHRNWSERKCNEDLQNIRQSVMFRDENGELKFLKILAPWIQHGKTDKSFSK